MLVKLSLRNFAIIDSLTLEPGTGLCLLTGETGAGKSILVEAIGLLSGRRANTEVVKNGRSSAVVEGVFLPRRHADRLASLLHKWEVDFDGEIIIRRRVSRDGRSSATLNGSTVTLRQLQELGALLVQVNGQNQSRQLLDEEEHLKILDGLPNVRENAGRTSEAWETLEKAMKRLKALRESTGQREQRLDTINFQLREINLVNPKPGEEASLKADASRLKNAGAIVESAAGLAEVLAGDDSVVAAGLGEARKLAAALAEMDPGWESSLEEFDSAASVLSSLSSEAERTASLVEFEPQRLEELLQRIADIERLKKKYGPTLDDVCEHREKLEKELEASSGEGLSEDEAAKEVEDAFLLYLRAAGLLSKVRASAAEALSRSAEAALRPLAMEKALFKVELLSKPAPSPEEARPGGLETVRFLFSANPGEPPLPLSKIASGGELSRTLLAILTAANPDAAPDSLVFDEIDVGIGGRPAESVGRSMKKLASHHQVLCITHLPQIAAFADWHATVEKITSGTTTSVSVTVLDKADRVKEIARMLAGVTVEKSALDHARSLLASARRS